MKFGHLPCFGKISFGALIAAVCAFGAQAEMTMPPDTGLETPIYKVTVESGSVDLQEATVTVRDERGVVKTQTGVDLATASGTIVKLGAGELKMLGGREAFAGAIHVKQGVLRVSNMYPLGGDSAVTYVHEGATLIADYSNPTNVDNTSIYGTVFFEGGTGAAGQHGQYVMIKGSNIRAPLAKKTVLGTNTTWNIRSSICWDSSKHIDLQGHELTVNNEDCDKSDATLYVDSVIADNPGGIVADGMNCFDFRGISAKSFLGDGYFKFVNGTPLNFPESYRAKHKMEWRLILTDETELSERRAASKDYGTMTDLPNTTWTSFGGLTLPDGKDLVLKSAETINNLYNYAPFAIMGKFTGNGGITYDTEAPRCSGWAITLASPDNDFTGGVNLYTDSRLDLLGGGNALPANGGDLKMADGGVLGLGAGDYTLPGAEFTGNAAASNTSATAATGAWTKPVVKKGAGTLDYLVSVGGSELDVREGTVRLDSGYSDVAGLNKGYLWFADYGAAAVTKESDKKYMLLSETEPTLNEKGIVYTKGYFHVTNATALAEQGFNYADPTNGNAAIGYMIPLNKDWERKFSYDNSTVGFPSTRTATNETVRSIDIAYDSTKLANHPRYWVFTYGGYLWNDSDEDVTWTVASAFNDHQVWTLNGTTVYKMDTGRLAETNPERAVFQLTLHPGPNAFSVRTYNQYVSSPNYCACATNGFKNATLDFGMGYAKSVTDSDDVNDYLKFEDAGDGALFTREIEPARARFDKVRIAEGATLDLCNAVRGKYAPHVFATVEGAGSIVNGFVKITDSLVLVTNAVGGAAKLTVSGKVTFAPGAKLAIADGMAFTRTTAAGEIVDFLEAEAIEGTPALDASLAGRWRLVRTGNALKLVSEISEGGDVLSVTGGRMSFKLAGDWASAAGLREGWKFATGTDWTEGSTGIPGYYGVDAPNSHQYQSCFRVTNETALAEMETWTSTDWKNPEKTSAVGYGLPMQRDWDGKTVDLVADVSKNLTAPLENGPVLNRPEMLFVDNQSPKTYSRYISVTYSGYLWNDEPTNVTWTVLSLADCAMRLVVDDVTYSQNLDKTSGRGNSSKPTDCHQFQVNLKPHANRFELYAANSYVNAGNFAQATNDLEHVAEVYDGHNCSLVLGYDPLGRGSKDVRDYQQFADAGNGELLTLTSTAPTNTLPQYSSLQVADGAVLDLNNIRGVDASYQFGAVSGAGSVANGDIAIGELITVAKADLEAGKSLQVTGKVTLGEGAIVRISGNERLTKGAEPYTVLTAEGGIEGIATLDPSHPDANRWAVVKSGNKLLLQYQASGILLLVR